MNHFSKLLCSACCILGMQVSTSAQTFNAATSNETDFPLFGTATPFYVDNGITYLQCNSHWVFYAPPWFGGTAALAAWSHPMYLNTSGVSATDGGGFSYGMIDPINGDYHGYGVITMPNASNISVAYLYGGQCAENLIVTYAVPGVGFTDICRPYCTYYYQMYHWNHTSTPPTPVGGPVSLTSGSYFDRISLDINEAGNRAAIVWGHNSKSLFSMAFDFSGSTLAVSTTTTITPYGNLADIAFEKDPVSGAEMLHYAYFDYMDRSFCEDLPQADETIGATQPAFVHGVIPFNDIMTGSFAGPIVIDDINQNNVDLVNLTLDCPGEHVDGNWAYTWNETSGSDIWLRLYTGAMWPSAVTLAANNGLAGTAPRLTSGVHPVVSYGPTFNRLFVGFAGGPNGYVSEEATETGLLFSTSDYLNIPNTSNPTGTPQRVATSKNSTGDWLYTVFTQEDGSGNLTLMHKAHPWTSSSTYRIADAGSTTQPLQLSLHPNPFTAATLRLRSTELREQEGWRLQVYNILGQPVASLSGTVSGINAQLGQAMDKVAAGQYFFSVTTPENKKQNLYLTKMSGQ